MCFDDKAYVATYRYVLGLASNVVTSVAIYMQGNRIHILYLDSHFLSVKYAQNKDYDSSKNIE